MKKNKTLKTVLNSTKSDMINLESDPILSQNKLLITENIRLKNHQSELEKIISKRTHDHTNLLKELKEKNEEIEVKNNNLDLLLQEVHHRVANNLQIILSLINIKYLSNNNTLDIPRFKDLESRILSMSLIHQNIINKGFINKEAFGSYISDLVRHIQSNNNFKQTINLVKNIDSFSILPNTILYLGLIITEIISNSIKHGFQDVECPTISIRIYKDQYHNIFEIDDNGSGFDRQLWEQQKVASGIDVIKLLTEQIDGEIIYQNENKTKFELTIPFS